MKTILIFVFVSQFIGCNSQNVEKIIISNFIESTIFVDSTIDDNLSQFLEIDRNSKNEKLKLIKFNIEFLKQELSKQEYSILSYNEFKDKNEFKEYEIHYKNLDNVYCMVIENKYITLFVIENDKIISFFSGIIKLKDRIFPYFLNKP